MSADSSTNSPRVSDHWTPAECAEAFESDDHCDASDLATLEHLRDYAPIHAATSEARASAQQATKSSRYWETGTDQGVKWYTLNGTLATVDYDGTAQPVVGRTTISMGRRLTRAQARSIAAELWLWAEGQEV